MGVAQVPPASSSTVLLSELTATSLSCQADHSCVCVELLSENVRGCLLCVGHVVMVRYLSAGGALN